MAFLVLFIVSSGFLAGSFYFAHRIFAPDYGGEYSEALIGTVKSINPLYSGTSDVDGDIVKLIYSGLMRYDGSGNLIPDLAENFNVSADFKTYTFTLREGLRWHDGDAIDAEDVVFTIKSIQDSSWKSQLSISFAGAEVTAKDPRTIQFVLKEPFAPFLSTLTVGILPKHLWGGVPPGQARLSDLNFKPIGSGPFKFRSYVRSKDGGFRSYTVERNELFYRKKPYLEKIIFRFYPDYSSAEQALVHMSVLGLQYLRAVGSTSNFPNEGVDKNPEIGYYKLKLPHYTALFLNTRKNDILADQSVRRALALGLDRERILRESIQAEGSIINGPILEGFIGFNPLLKGVPFDPAQGAALLDSSGWKLGATSTVRKKKTTELSLKITTVDRPEYRSAASIAEENWKELGVDVKTEFLDSSTIQPDAIRPRNYDALLYGEILGIDPDPYPFWHSSQVDDPGLNLSGFIHRDADKLLEEARVLSTEERASRYRSFQEILTQELPAIFLYTPDYIYPIRKIVNGFDVKILSTPSDRFANVEDWYIKTKRAFK